MLGRIHERSPTVGMLKPHATCARANASYTVAMLRQTRGIDAPASCLECSREGPSGKMASVRARRVYMHSCD